MTDETFRRRVLACVGSGLAVGIAGCSGGGGEDGDADDGDGTATDGTPGMDETTEEPADATATGGSKALTLEVLGRSDFESEVITVESLTFVAAAADDDSPTLDVGETADISDGEYQDAVVVADDLQVPYGTYESVEMTVTPGEIRDEEGAAVDVSGGTVSQSFTDIDDEPNTVEESGFDATLTLYLSIREGRFEVTGYSSVGL